MAARLPLTSNKKESVFFNTDLREALQNKTPQELDVIIQVLSQNILKLEAQAAQKDHTIRFLTESLNKQNQ